MNEQEHAESSHEREDGAAWPYTAMLVFGYFGADSPEGRRLAVRNTVGLALLIVTSVVLGAPVGVAARAAAALFFTVVVAMMVYEQVRYVRVLDELSQLLQLKAMAAAYGAAAVLLAAMFAFFEAWDVTLSPRWFLLPVLAELIRAAALVYMAKRHE